MGFLCSNPCRAAHPVVVFAGIINTETWHARTGQVLAMMARGALALTVDLTQVTSMDSAGAVMLVFLHNEARTRGGHATFLGAPRPVLDLLHTSGADDVIDIRA